MFCILPKEPNHKETAGSIPARTFFYTDLVPLLYKTESTFSKEVWVKCIAFYENGNLDIVSIDPNKYANIIEKPDSLVLAYEKVQNENR